MSLLCLACAGPAPTADGTLLGEPTEGDGPVVVFDLLDKPLPKIPLPNDVATRLDASSPSGRYVNVSRLAPTFLESDTRSKANQLDGFGTFMPISVSFDRPLDLVDILARHRDNDDLADDTVYLVDVDPSSPELGRIWPVDLGTGNFPITLEKRNNYFENDGHRFSSNILFETVDEDRNQNGQLDPGEDRDGDEVLDRPNRVDPTKSAADFLPEGMAAADLLCDAEQFRAQDLEMYQNLASFWEEESLTLIFRPVLPLRPLTRYAVVLTTRLKDRENQSAVRSPWPGKYHAAQTEALKPLVSEGILSALGLTVDEVAFAWTYTTGSTTRELEWVRAGLYGHGKMGYLAEEFPPASFYVDETTTNAETPFYAPGNEFQILLPILASEIGGSPETVSAILQEVGQIGGVVMGEFESPNFLVDRDGVAQPDYPADDDEIFQINPVTGESVHGAQRVTWWCVLPKRDPAIHGDRPFKTVIYGHGYTSTRFEMLAFSGRAVRFGLALCGLDAFGHGLVLPTGTIEFGGEDITYQQLLTDVIGQLTSLAPFAQSLLKGRARDLDNDGERDSGGDFWTADIFHTRDVVRQTIVDHMQFIRLLRSFDGTRTWVYDTSGDGTGDLAGDFDGDGIVDLGGDEDNYYMWGQSLGGIIAAILGGIEPSLVAFAPVAGGAGLMDIGVRSRQGGVPEAVFLPLMGPFVVGNPAEEGAGVALKFLVNNVNNQSKHPFAVLETAGPGDRLELHNLHNGEVKSLVIGNDRKFRLGIPADALSGSERRAVLGMDDDNEPVTVMNPLKIGDPLQIRLYSAGAGTLKEELNIFETDVHFQGTVYPEGAPLVAISKGLGLRRNSPELRRMMGISQMILEAGDPVSYAPFYDQPLDFSYDETCAPGANALVIPTAGDMNVPVNTGIQIARAAGLIELSEANPRYVGTPYEGYSDNRMLIETASVEAIECLPNWRNEEGLPVLFDVDDLSEGLSPWNSPTLRSTAGIEPLRLTVAATHVAGGVHGMRMPLVERTGTHGFEPPRPSRVFDVDNYMNNLVYAYFLSGGTVIPDHPCLEDSSCNNQDDAPSLPFESSDWELASDEGTETDP